MAYKHGVYCSEIPTSVIPPVNTTAGLPVVFGTAPIHLATDPAPVNRPVICYTYAEAVKYFGYSADWDKYTLCEVMYSQFMLYNRAPVVFVNVLDPATHKQAVSETEVTVTEKIAKVNAAVLIATLKVAATSGGEALVKDTDYTAAYNDDEELVITCLSGGALAAASSVFVSYDKVDPGAVAASDVIGGVSVATGAKKAWSA